MIYPRLTRHLTLEAEESTPDQSGGFTSSWQQIGTLWAEIKPKTGREARGPNTPVSKVGYVIHVRGAPDGAPSRPQPGQRFSGHGRIYVIEAVTEYDPDGRFLTCHTTQETVV